MRQILLFLPLSKLNSNPWTTLLNSTLPNSTERHPIYSSLQSKALIETKTPRPSILMLLPLLCLLSKITLTATTVKINWVKPTSYNTYYSSRKPEMTWINLLDHMSKWTPTTIIPNLRSVENPSPIIKTSSLWVLTSCQKEHQRCMSQALGEDSQEEWTNYLRLCKNHWIKQRVLWQQNSDKKEILQLSREKDHTRKVQCRLSSFWWALWLQWGYSCTLWWL